jgi:hypothetical protein
MSSQPITLSSTYIATEREPVVPTIDILGLKLEVLRNYNGKNIRTVCEKNHTILNISAYRIIGQLTLKTSSRITEANIEDYIKRNLVLYEKKTPVIPQHELNCIISTEMRKTTTSISNFWVSFAASASLGGDQSKTSLYKLKIFEDVQPYYQFKFEFTPFESTTASIAQEELQNAENLSESFAQAPQDGGSESVSSSTSSKRKQDFEPNYREQRKRNKSILDEVKDPSLSNHTLSSENRSLQDEPKELISMYSSLSQENQFLQANLNFFRNNHQKLFEENNFFRNKINVLDAYVQQLETSYATEVGKNSSLQKQTQDLNGEVGMHNQRIAVLQQYVQLLSSGDGNDPTMFLSMQEKLNSLTPVKIVSETEAKLKGEIKSLETALHEQRVLSELQKKQIIKLTSELQKVKCLVERLTSAKQVSNPDFDS